MSDVTLPLVGICFSDARKKLELNSIDDAAPRNDTGGGGFGACAHRGATAGFGGGEADVPAER